MIADPTRIRPPDEECWREGTIPERTRFGHTRQSGALPGAQRNECGTIRAASIADRPTGAAAIERSRHRPRAETTFPTILAPLAVDVGQGPLQCFLDLDRCLRLADRFLPGQTIPAPFSHQFSAREPQDPFEFLLGGNARARAKLEKFGS